MTQTAAYGAWPSPLRAATVAEGNARIVDLQCDRDATYWIEGRPAEGGRCVIVRCRDGSIEDILPAPFSARTFVHEYGGGAFVAQDGDVYFSNAADRRLYAVRRGDPVAVTPAMGDLRFADMIVDAARKRLITVAEDHRDGKVVNDIREVALDTGSVRTLIGGNDFYSSPRLSPDGSRLAWLTWDNPNMPWDGTELWVASLSSTGDPVDARLVAGGRDESIFQPAWSPDAQLHYVSDRTGWWNLYRDAAGGAEAVLPIDADCGAAAWVFRLATYAFLDGGRVAVCVSRDGLWELHVVVPGTDGARHVPLPYNDIDGAIDVAGGHVMLVAGGASVPLSVVRVDPGSGDHAVIRPGSSVQIADGMLSVAQPITYAGHAGDTAHAFFYAPRNDAVRATEGTLPPLLVRAHGGPTSATSPALDPSVQYWTSRGFAFLDADYGGSTGYGRDYRRRLNGQEGVVDVGDCVAGALHLAAEGLVDPDRLLIYGGSAGGYIVLCAMTFHDVFAAGCSLFGISDMELLVADTHKFEARYFDSMVGPYPEAKQLYHDRSPIHFIERVRRPVLLLQGLDDPIVPPNQAQLMFDGLRAGGIPVAYIGFPGEQHGFRQAATIVRALEAQLSFFWQVLGLEPAEAIDPVEIAGLA